MGVELRKNLLRNKLSGRLLGTNFGMNEEQHVRKSGTKIAAIRVLVTRRTGNKSKMKLILYEYKYNIHITATRTI